MPTETLPLNTFRRALYAGQQQIGMWCAIPSPFTIEMLAGAGYDWLLVDTEHTPADLPQIYAELQAAAAGKAHPVVRVPWNDSVAIKRFLDAGAQSLLIPMVQTAEEARQAVAATRYPPHGIRGFAGGTRATRFGRIADYHQQAHEEICVLVQIETAAALDELEAICAVEGIDGVFIGPGDLTASLGHLGGQGEPEMVELIEKTLRRIVAAGNRPGILTPDPALARRYIAAGSLFTSVAIDFHLLTRSAETLAAEFAAK
ncbi:2,4-dihydroxyhept-2-ene-1,7-dioic acid aldolase [Azorhizobium oxalatiphilum]|uniref:2,4-dihydroxyhept-2-ene-1,7-dioic acid aldolase n=1 Tax=Azorhizobium oxalatiphilum TaxID=980631 RepID=A0A917FLC7_9HYPH|nr:HpcH/HpaI aldolase/citrate lyase family protein [Azorhizobium oxalatiphilum]GGF87386.1 2,4-dihydroxyhept-2-ene-1,7-dioic acid aldolase [Azorhizobium oxalatiphilum]